VRKYIIIQLEGGNMKTWRISGFLIILIIGFLLMSGCTSTKSTNTAPVTTTLIQTAKATQPPNTGSSTPSPIPVVTVPTVPAKGVYVHINYLGGWFGAYGASQLTPVADSGNKYYPVVNATGTVRAQIKKLDSTQHTLVVEILKDGKVLGTASNSTGFGNVFVSVNV
jgi:hypothetical protein